MSPLLWFAVTFVLAVETPATILIPKDLGELSREAELIVVADVGPISCAWNDDRTLIWTTSQLRVREVWKGSIGPTINVTEPGGEVGEVGQMVADMARYESGARVLAFLKRDALQQWRTHGCIQGCFPIRLSNGPQHVALADGFVRRVIRGYFPEDTGKSTAHTIDLDRLQAKVQTLAWARTEGK